MKPTEQFKKDLKDINRYLCQNGYFHGARLLAEMARGASRDREAMKLFFAWMVSKSTVDLKAAATGYSYLFNDDLAHFNAVDAIDTATLIVACAA